jgi:hypothetical protein
VARSITVVAESATGGWMCAHGGQIRVSKAGVQIELLVVAD